MDRGGGFLEGFMHGHMMGGRFSAQLRAYTITLFPNFDSQKCHEINYGGKILLPNSVLDQLVRLNIQYPMLFKITNPELSTFTHCGVLEFSAQEGQCFLPEWMMYQLCLAEGSMIRIESANLPKAKDVKLKPQSTDFLAISNPRAVLEVELRKFACLSKDDMISVQYADQILRFLVTEVKPAAAVCIIECDVNLEFDAPEGYQETDTRSTAVKPAAPSITPIEPPKQAFQAFSGSGLRLDGRKKPSSNSVCSESGVGTSNGTAEEPVITPVVCNESYVPGQLSFVRYDYKNRVELEKEMREKAKAAPKMSAFEGTSK
ncbi:hypothetical protein WR25_21346 [Diploscapter pachys]|uniref:Uncharacterized protein n=1 Tax=Diploscapter pachys TaxID=2018661 RepID=A0A2A2KQD7_9BILA|nr:hypothetical protein WR25_21346 [Diploscapter pachys]